MHTTEQAKQLWCPMGRVGVLPKAGGPAGVNDPDVEFKTNCIADRCAMWRWLSEVSPDWTRPTTPPFSFMPPPLVQSTMGFCGLAGKPIV